MCSTNLKNQPCCDCFISALVLLIVKLEQKGVEHQQLTYRLCNTTAIVIKKTKCASAVPNSAVVCGGYAQLPPYQIHFVPAFLPVLFLRKKLVKIIADIALRFSYYYTGCYRYTLFYKQQISYSSIRMDTKTNGDKWHEWGHLKISGRGFFPAVRQG